MVAVGTKEEATKPIINYRPKKLNLEQILGKRHKRKPVEANNRSLSKQKKVETNKP
jgi:hypothetical protein